MIASDLTPEQKGQLKELLVNYSDVFASNSTLPGRTSLVKHRIEVTDPKPIRHEPRAMPYTMKEKIAEMVQECLEKGVIRPSMSSYSNPIVLVRKKDGSLRFERFIERVMQDFLGKFMHVYFDDLLIVSETWTDHLCHIKNALERLREAGLRLKSTKCRIAAREVEFLGHRITAEGLMKDGEKVKAVKEFPRP